MKKDEGFQQHKEPYWRRFLSRLIGKRKTVEEVTEEPKSTFDFEEDHKVPIEFDDTSLEVEEELPGNDEESSSNSFIGSDKDDLSQKDIDDIIFGRK
jgi:hypothetical protein